MKSIAAICADSAELNPGMLSVDLALACLLREVPGDTEVVYFNPKHARSVEGSRGALRYKLLQDVAELERFDTVIYWGDFVHWLRYAHWDWLYNNPGVALGYTAAQMVSQWYRLFMLEAQTDRFQNKVVVFGGTLYGLTAQDYSNPRYQSALKTLYGNARLVAQRDFVSANLMQEMAPQRGFSMGCDCAFFLDADAILPMAAAQHMAGQQVPERFVVCSFGRSGANQALTRYAKDLADALQLPLVAMDWLGHPQGLDGLAFKLAVIRKAAVLVTDTYHCAVSGWREGIPVIGIGQALAHGVSTVDDKKKELFFRQIMASDYYLYSENVIAAMDDPATLQKLIQQAVDAVSDSTALAVVGSVLRNQVGAAKSKLLTALCASLDA